MNAKHIARIAWKDYRRLRSFWLALVSFWLFGLVIASYVALSSREAVPQLYASYVLISILITAMFYGLGCSGTTLACEHEENTFGFLRALPVTAKSVFYGKLLYGTVSTLLLIVMLVLLCLLHWWLMGQRISYAWDFDEFAAKQTWFWTAGIPLAIAVGLFWSLLVNRPLLAIGLAGGSMVLVSYAGFRSASVIGWAAGWNVGEWDNLAWAVPAWFAIAGLVLFVDRRLADRWLPTHGGADHAVAGNQHVAARSRSAGATTPWPLALDRLLWLNFRQGWLATLVLGGVGTLLAVLSIGQFGPPQVLALLVLGLLGVDVFRHEHEQDRYRLLGQFGVRGFAYWFSRVVPALLIAILISALVGAAAGKSIKPVGFPGNSGWDYNFAAVWLTFWCGVATFAIAQFCSLAFRSTIIALAATIMGSILLWLWFGYCLLFAIPAWLGMVPVVVLPLVASYFRIPRWFGATDSWKQWLVPAVPLVVLILGVPLASVCFRAFEVPVVQLPFEESERNLWLGEPPSAAAVATGEAYARAFERVTAPSDPRGARLLEAATQDPGEWTIEPEVVNELMAISRREEAVFPTRDDRVYASAGLLLADAILKVREGELDEAWSRYEAILRMARHRNDVRSGMYGALAAYELERAVNRELVPWAMAQGNSAEQIEEAAQWLNAHREDQPRWTSVLEAEYAWVTEVIENVRPGQLTPQDAWQLHWLRRLAPWELERARRLRDYFTARSYRRLAELELNPRLLAVRTNADLDADHPWIATTKFPMLMAEIAPKYAAAAASIEHERRGIIYQLAAIAHHKRTGSYPGSVDELAQASSVTIPDDLFGPGKMELVRVERQEHTSEKFHVLYVASKDRKPGGGTTSVDSIMNRAFPLPNFDQ